MQKQTISEVELDYRSQEQSRNMSEEKQWLIHNSFLEDFSFWRFSLDVHSKKEQLIFKNAYADYCDYLVRDGRTPISYGLFIVRISE